MAEIDIPSIIVNYGDCSWFDVNDSFHQKIEDFKNKLHKNLSIVAHSHLWPGYFPFEWDVWSTLSFKIDTNFEKGNDPFCDYRRMLLEYSPFVVPNCISPNFAGNLFYQIECLSRYFSIDLKALHKEISFCPKYENWKELFLKAISLNNEFVKIFVSGNPLNRPDYSYLE